ncbi:MAG: lipid-A-disaccharide synthase [Vulcanimicrobiaceae bacterium]
MRYFISTGEASGELNATLLAQAMRGFDPQAEFEGIGAAAMRACGFRIWRDHTGWASMGPMAALPRIPKLLSIMWLTAAHIARTRPDLLVLVDFGAFNVRLAGTLRERLGYRGAILYWFPPAAWLDDGVRAHHVAAACVPVTAFLHQYEFYKQQRLPVVYFGHPLAARYSARHPRAEAPIDGGRVALLPGSRRGEIRAHLPILLAAVERLRVKRPRLHVTIGVAEGGAQSLVRKALAKAALQDVRVVRGVVEATQEADAAWVASGTAVLECALLGVVSIALYVISPLLVKHARKIYRGTYITLPNLVLGRELIPEFLQERATPDLLAAAMDSLMVDSSVQRAGLDELRQALGPSDALEQTARFAVALAQTGSK